MNKTQQATIEDLQFDDRNFNKHTEFGLSLLEKSLRNNGAGRSILIDKNNRIIGGNGVVEVAGQIGLDKVRIVESDGTEIIAVKRTDIDLDSKQGREMALADNATAAADLEWDAEVLADISSEYDFDLNAWGVILDESAQYGDEFTLPDGNQTFKTMTFTLAPEQADAIEDALRMVDEGESFGNTNSNGNKLYNIVSQWVAAKK